MLRPTVVLLDAQPASAQHGAVREAEALCPSGAITLEES
jgi:hypothetical protein